MIYYAFEWEHLFSRMEECSKKDLIFDSLQFLYFNACQSVEKSHIF